MKKTRNNRLGLRLLSLLLTLVLLAGLVACTTEPTPTQPSQNMQGTTAATLPTTLPSTPPTTIGPTEPPKREQEPLVYTLIQEDVDLFYSLLEQYEALAIAGENMEAIEETYEQLDAQYEYLEAQYSIANIIFCCNTKDKTLEEQYLSAVDIATSANDAYIQMTRRIYESDTPVKDALFEGWTEQDIAQLLAYDEEISRLNKRNEEITVEYRNALSDTKRIPLYIEFVQNNNKIAQFYGYDNYYAYAYEQVYGRDYDPETIQQMRQYAKQYMVPMFETARCNFYNNFYGLGEGNRNNVINFLQNNYNQQYENYVSLYIAAMPDSMSRDMSEMLEYDSIFTDYKYAKPGAFTTMVGDRSYCYFGPGYSNSSTVIHEAGHYYASRYMDMSTMSLDLAETHSQGNEWLFVHYIKDYMPALQYKAVVNYRLYNDVAMTFVAIMVDEFEEKVYTTDLTDFTASDFNALMDSVVVQYFPLEYAKDYIMDLNQYWRKVVVEQPVYYISYGVSAIAALDLYTVAVEDFDQAVSIYQKLCEESDPEKGFLDNIHEAGLSSPFEEEFYIELVALVESHK